MKLNEKQSLAMKKVIEGHNLYIGGPGGVGKSVLVREIQDKFGDSCVFLAPTGIAALNIGGATIHSTFKFPHSFLTKRDAKNVHQKTADLFSPTGSVKRIVIDEISMVRGDMMAAIDQQLRLARRKNVPFGGLQVIVVGDFFQLPPVLTQRDKSIYFRDYSSVYAFGDETWSAAQFDYIELDQIMRQSDTTFIEHLQNIRTKKAGYQESVRFFNRVGSENSDDVLDMDPTFICSTNRATDIVNTQNYSELDGEERTFRARKWGQIDSEPSPTELQLKFGTKVIFTANTEEAMNGEIGYVVGFVGDKVKVLMEKDESEILVGSYKWEQVEFINKGNGLAREVIGTYEQLPIKHGWAVTIHKCMPGHVQVMTPTGKRRLDQLHVGDMVQSRTGWNNVLNHWATGKKKQYTITLESGRTVSSSADHQFYAARNGKAPEFIELSSLRVGDHLSVSAQPVEFVDNGVSVDLSYLMGMLIGDGCYSESYRADHRIDFTTADVELERTFTDFMESRGLQVGQIYTNKKSPQCVTLYTHSKQIRSNLEELGLDYATARNKCIPEILKSSTLECRAALISGLLDTDGHVSKQHNKFVFATSSKTLAEDIREVLDTLGVFSSVHTQNDVSYQTVVTGRSSVDLANLLSLKVGYKADRCKQIARSEIKRENRDSVPFMKAVNNYTKSQLVDRGEALHTQPQYLWLGDSPKNRRKYIDECIKHGVELHPDVSEGMRFEKIISIDEGSEEEMFDIEVANDHNFYADGVLVHNCQGLTLPSGVIDLGRGAFCHGQTYVALSRIKTLDGMALISNIRNQDIIVDPEVREFYDNDCRGVGLF